MRKLRDTHIFNVLHIISVLRIIINIILTLKIHIENIFKFVLNNDTY